MKITTIEQVKEFHEKFNHPVKDEPDLSDDKLNALRRNLLQEELNELTDALHDKDPVKVLDALSDLQYVLDGAYLSLGLWRWKEQAFNEVQRSNMSKLGEGGKPIYRADGKILKGPNFTPPDLKSVLERCVNES